MNEPSPVLTERRDGILVVTIDRRDARNAVNFAVAEGIGRAMDALDDTAELTVGSTRSRAWKSLSDFSTRPRSYPPPSPGRIWGRSWASGGIRGAKGLGRGQSSQDDAPDASPNGWLTAPTRPIALRARIAVRPRGRCFLHPLRCPHPTRAGGGNEKALQGRQQTS